MYGEKTMLNQKYCGKCLCALVFFVAYLFVGAGVLLWSWNTGAELFQWPVAEYRHALAAMLTFLLAVLPLCCRFRHSHGGYYAGNSCKTDDNTLKS
jgi:hypothetical protein